MLALKLPGMAFMFTGWLNPVTTFLAEKFLMFLVENTALGASMILINFETAQEKRAYEQAIKEAYDAIKKGQYLTTKQEQELEQAVIDSTKQFIRMRRVSNEKT